MSYAEYNRVITIAEYAETVTAGDVSQGYGTTAEVRCKITQVDGARFLKEDELIDRALWKIECWDEGWSNNIKIVFEGQTLYPVRPPTRNPGKGNFAGEMIIYAATKR